MRTTLTEKATQILNNTANEYHAGMSTPSEIIELLANELSSQKKRKTVYRNKVNSLYNGLQNLAEMLTTAGAEPDKSVTKMLETYIASKTKVEYTYD